MYVCEKWQLWTACILGDPGADSGAEDENQNGREKIRRAKERKKNTSPWGQTLYEPVPEKKTFLPNQERVFVRPFGTGA